MFEHVARRSRDGAPWPNGPSSLVPRHNYDHESKSYVPNPSARAKSKVR